MLDLTTSRRSFLKVGALGLGGLTLPGLLRARAAQAAGSARKSVILIWQAGGPSHIDMYDLKPNAPAEVRGEFKPIPTNVPGIMISEHLPRQAKIMDRLAVGTGGSKNDIGVGSDNLFDRVTSVPPKWDFTKRRRIAGTDLVNGFSDWNGRVVLEWPEWRARLTMTADAGLRHLVV